MSCWLIVCLIIIEWLSISGNSPVLIFIKALSCLLISVCMVFLHYFNFLSREGPGTPLQYSCLETPMDRGAWWAAVHGVARSWTRLNDFTFTFHFHALEKETATHSSVLAWRILGTAEPGGLLSMGLHRVRHDWGDLAVAAATFYLFISLCWRWVFCRQHNVLSCFLIHLIVSAF